MIKKSIETLQRGEYWIGDPCYVLNEANGFDWEDLLTSTRCLGLFSDDDNTIYAKKDEQHGIFTIHNVGQPNHDFTIGVSGTEHGDGVYSDSDGNKYGVDAGMLAAIPVEAINAEVLIQRGALGRIVMFDDPFTVEYDDGAIRFGHVAIQTGTARLT